MSEQLEPSVERSNPDPMARVPPTPDNPRGYPLFDLSCVLSYSNAQIDYYRRNNKFTVSETKKFVEALKLRKDMLDLMGMDAVSDDDGEDASHRTNSTPVTSSNPSVLPHASTQADQTSANVFVPPQVLDTHAYDDEEPDSDCPMPSQGVRGQKFNVGDVSKLQYNTDNNHVETWLTDIHNVFDSNPAMFPDGKQKIIRATLMMEDRLKSMHTNAVSAYPKLRVHWRKFIRWLESTVLRGGAKKDQAACRFTQASQGWGEDPHLFYQRLFGLANQTGRLLTMDDYVTRLTGPLQSELKPIRMLRKHQRVEELVDDATQLWATRSPDDWKLLCQHIASKSKESKGKEKETPKTSKFKNVHVTKLSDEEREYRKKNHLCFRCGFPNHSSDKCMYKFNPARVKLHRDSPRSFVGLSSAEASKPSSSTNPLFSKKRVRATVAEGRIIEDDSDDTLQSTRKSKKE